MMHLTVQFMYGYAAGYKLVDEMGILGEWGRLLMRGKRNHFRCYILTGLMLLSGILYSKMAAFAGDINGNEAGVIAAASGTFSYDGKTYQADSEYIGSLTSYLSGDDVDLTADQANEAISRMYASVEEGVARGYLYEVGKESGNTETAATQEDWVSAESEEEAASGRNEKEGKTDSDIWTAMENSAEAESKLAERPKKKAAAVIIRLEKEGIVVTTKKNETACISKNGPLYLEQLRLGVDITAGMIFTIALFCGFFLSAIKCVEFLRKKDMRIGLGWSQCHRLRRNIRMILTVIASASLVCIFLLLGSYISLFHEDFIIQNMENSGYFRYAYSEYISSMEADETSAGLKEEGEPVAYEAYLLTVKQDSRKVLEGQTNIKIQNSNFTPYIYTIKNSYIELFRVAGVLVFSSMVISVLLLLFMDQKRERGIKHVAFAELGTSMVLIVLTVAMGVGKPHLHLYIEPDYLYLFLAECIQWSIKVMTSITAFTVVLGMILIGVCQAAGNHNYESKG